MVDLLDRVIEEARLASNPQDAIDMVIPFVQKWGNLPHLIGFLVEAFSCNADFENARKYVGLLAECPLEDWEASELESILRFYEAEARYRIRPVRSVAVDALKTISEFANCHNVTNRAEIIINRYNWLKVLDSHNFSKDKARSWLRAVLAGDSTGANIDDWRGDVSWCKYSPALWVKLFDDSSIEEIARDIEGVPLSAMETDDSDAELHYYVARAYDIRARWNSCLRELYLSGAISHYDYAFRLGGVKLRERIKRLLNNRSPSQMSIVAVDRNQESISTLETPFGNDYDLINKPDRDSNKLTRIRHTTKKEDNDG